MPWCVRKCPYCDFNSHQLKSVKPDGEYIDILIRDFDQERELLGDREIETVFFGGGTPSLFQPEDFARLLTALRQRSVFAADVEITLEANPGAIERGKFAGYRDAGINRVSLGAQTFSAEALKRLGRIHSADDTERAVEELHAAGLGNFNLDLMYALPEQEPEEALADVARAVALGPAHISHYQLTLEPGTVFHARPPPLPDEDTAWHIQTECQRLLREAGFMQYEISAYAREGARCRHNLNYWRFGDYLGIGAGAHGKLTESLPERILRTEKPKQPGEYRAYIEGGEGGGPAAKGRAGGRRHVPVDELPFEYMLNSLRLNEGFAAADFTRRTGLQMGVIEARIARALARGLIEPHPAGWRPTELGSRFLNELQAGFLE